MKSKLYNEQENIKRYLNKDNKTITEIAKIYGVSPRVLREFCNLSGITFKKDPILSKWSDNEISIVREMLLSGESVLAISNHLGTKSPSQIDLLFARYGDQLNLVKGERKHKHSDKIERIRELVNDGYTRNEIGEILGIHPSVVLKLRLDNGIKKPSMAELQDRGIFYLTRKGSKEIRYETDLTKEKLISLLDSGKSRKEIAEMYGLGPRLISTIASRIGRNDPKIASAKEIKRKVFFDITGKDATEEDLKKAFIDIFTKDYLEDLLKRNGYCYAKCSSELGGIDSKCFIEAVKKFDIEIPEEIREDLFLARENSSGFGASKFMPNSIGEYFTEKALSNLNLSFNRQIYLQDAIPKSIRPNGISIDYGVSYSGNMYYIEYNGKPHYNYSPMIHKGNPDIFINQVKRDLYLKKYCKENNIFYIEIPYILYSVQDIEDYLRRIIFNNEDANNLIDFSSILGEIKELQITID